MAIKDHTAKFLSLIDKSGDCWEWNGKHFPTGYGRFYHRGSQYTHRYSYEMFVGPIPEGLEIDHLCRNRGCLKPSHLEAVTHRENVLRSPIAVGAMNRNKTHCKRGHEFTEANTRNFTQKNGSSGRECLICKKWHGDKRYANIPEPIVNRISPRVMRRPSRQY